MIEFVYNPPPSPDREKRHKGSSLSQEKENEKRKKGKCFVNQNGASCIYIAKPYHAAGDRFNQGTVL